MATGTGCYVLAVVAEPENVEDKDRILQMVNKGLLSWDLQSTGTDLTSIESICTSVQEKGIQDNDVLIQYSTESLGVEVLVNPTVSTLKQCTKNLLTSTIGNKYIIHAGYTFTGTGSWILQNGTYSFQDFLSAFQESKTVSPRGCNIHIHCAETGDWSSANFTKEVFTKIANVSLNPPNKIESLPGTKFLVDCLDSVLKTQSLTEIMEASQLVGNIRFNRPTLYLFPAGEGDCALFGISGFNMLVDGGFNRKPCAWEFIRHLDRLDAILCTRLTENNLSSMSTLMKRKTLNNTHPQIGYVFCNIAEGKARTPTEELQKEKDDLLVSVVGEGHSFIQTLNDLKLVPHQCWSETTSEPFVLYHKVGHGTLEMYILSPPKDGKEMKDFLDEWSSYKEKFSSVKTKGMIASIPLSHVTSVCAILVWRPNDPKDTITRIMFPGSAPQNKIFEGLEKLKSLDILKHPTVTKASLSAVVLSKPKVKAAGLTAVAKNAAPSRKNTASPVLSVSSVASRNGDIAGIKKDINQMKEIKPVKEVKKVKKVDKAIKETKKEVKDVKKEVKKEPKKEIKKEIKSASEQFSTVKTVKKAETLKTDGTGVTKKTTTTVKKTVKKEVQAKPAPSTKSAEADTKKPVKAAAPKKTTDAKTMKPKTKTTTTKTSAAKSKPSPVPKSPSKVTRAIAASAAVATAAVAIGVAELIESKKEEIEQEEILKIETEKQDEEKEVPQILQNGIHEEEPIPSPVRQEAMSPALSEPVSLTASDTLSSAPMETVSPTPPHDILSPSKETGTKDLQTPTDYEDKIFEQEVEAAEAVASHPAETETAIDEGIAEDDVEDVIVNTTTDTETLQQDQFKADQNVMNTSFIGESLPLATEDNLTKDSVYLDESVPEPDHHLQRESYEAVYEQNIQSDDLQNEQNYQNIDEQLAAVKMEESFCADVEPEDHETELEEDHETELEEDHETELEEDQSVQPIDICDKETTKPSMMETSMVLDEPEEDDQDDDAANDDYVQQVINQYKESTEDVEEDQDEINNAQENIETGYDINNSMQRVQDEIDLKESDVDPDHEIGGIKDDDYVQEYQNENQFKEHNEEIPGYEQEQDEQCGVDESDYDVNDQTTGFEKQQFEKEAEYASPSYYDNVQAPNYSEEDIPVVPNDESRDIDFDNKDLHDVSKETNLYSTDLEYATEKALPPSDILKANDSSDIDDERYSSKHMSEEQSYLDEKDHDSAEDEEMIRHPTPPGGDNYYQNININDDDMRDPIGPHFIAPSAYRGKGPDTEEPLYEENEESGSERSVSPVEAQPVFSNVDKPNYPEFVTVSGGTTPSEPQSPKNIAALDVMEALSEHDGSENSMHSPLVRDQPNVFEQNVDESQELTSDKLNTDELQYDQEYLEHSTEKPQGHTEQAGTENFSEYQADNQFEMNADPYSHEESEVRVESELVSQLESQTNIISEKIEVSECREELQSECYTEEHSEYTRGLESNTFEVTPDFHQEDVSDRDFYNQQDMSEQIDDYHQSDVVENERITENEALPDVPPVSGVCDTNALHEIERAPVPEEFSSEYSNTGLYAEQQYFQESSRDSYQYSSEAPDQSNRYSSASTAEMDSSKITDESAANLTQVEAEIHEIDNHGEGYHQESSTMYTEAGVEVKETTQIQSDAYVESEMSGISHDQHCSNGHQSSESEIPVQDSYRDDVYNESAIPTSGLNGDHKSWTTYTDENDRQEITQTNGGYDSAFSEMDSSKIASAVQQNNYIIDSHYQSDSPEDKSMRNASPPELPSPTDPENVVDPLNPLSVLPPVGYDEVNNKFVSSTEEYPTDNLNYMKTAPSPGKIKYQQDDPYDESSEDEEDNRSVPGNVSPYAYTNKAYNQDDDADGNHIYKQQFNIGDNLESARTETNYDINNPPEYSENTMHVSPGMHFPSGYSDMRSADPGYDFRLEEWGKPMGLPTPQEPSTKTTKKTVKSNPTATAAKSSAKSSEKKTLDNGKSASKLTSSPVKKSKSQDSDIKPVYVDLAYVPHHADPNYSDVEFFKKIRARYYVLSGISPSRDVLNALLEAKKSWKENLEVTIIPTYETDTLGYWLAQNQYALSENSIEVAPSASRCTVNLQDHETSCAAYRLEF